MPVNLSIKNAPDDVVRRLRGRAEREAAALVRADRDARPDR